MKHDTDFMEKINKVLNARKAAAAILEVSELADGDELKNAYRKAAAKHHPDHNGNTVEANKRFVLIKCAYELLAFDKDCDELMNDVSNGQQVKDDCKYKMDNPWGHFLWWKDKFFESDESEINHKKNKVGSCI